MAENEIMIDASPEEVWAVLADPQTFDDWVLGAQNVRDADDSWPAVGSKLHHSTGVGPLTVDDETRVEEAVPPTRLVLLAKVGPIGEFRITLELRGADGQTTLFMQEDPVGGVAAHTPGTDSAITARNTISLGRLKKLAEGTATARP
ncbi:MAG: SRPBCC family protein [Actinobacteria bacterium]|nr:SRPBCC family protein [Actinomycetota bacterium]